MYDIVYQQQRKNRDKKSYLSVPSFEAYLKFATLFKSVLVIQIVGMLKSSELEKLWRYSNYGSHNLKDCSDGRSAGPKNLFSICPP